MSELQEVQKSARPSTVWIAACAMLCTAVLAYGLSGNKDTSGGLAYQVGYNLPIAIFLSGALHLFFRKRESAQTSWLGFAFVYASLISTALISDHRQKSELRVAAAEMQQSIAAVELAASSGQAPPTLLPITPATSGEIGKIEIFLKTMVNRVLSQHREYELELEAIGWSNILDGSRLKNDSTLTESRTMIQQAKDIVTKYQLRTDKLYAQMRRDIETSDMSAESKRSMLTGFDEKLSQGKSQAAELWSLEEQVLGQIENVFNLLSARRGGWQIQDGRVMFQRQADLELFNSYIEKVQAIVIKQKQVQSAAFQEAKDSLSAFGK